VKSVVVLVHAIQTAMAIQISEAAPSVDTITNSTRAHAGHSVVAYIALVIGVDRLSTLLRELSLSRSRILLHA
jgi:hypothetical protein